MRIAQVSPLTEAVPPKLYGGTERVISWLTEELVAMGHDVFVIDWGTPGDEDRLLSFDDIVQSTSRRDAPTAKDIVAALRGICDRRPVETA